MVWYTRTALPALCLALFGAGAGNAQVRAIAPQISYGDRAGVGIGARVVFGIDDWDPALEAQAGFDFFFPDEVGGIDVGFMEFNANVVYHFALKGRASVAPYAGGGFNLARRSLRRAGSTFVSNATDTDVGLNLLAGLRFVQHRLAPFVEARFELSGGDQAVITGGLRFPVG